MAYLFGKDHEWFVCKYKDGKYFDCSPFGMTKREAVSLKDAANARNDGFEYVIRNPYTETGDTAV